MRSEGHWVIHDDTQISNLSYWSNDRVTNFDMQVFDFVEFLSWSNENELSLAVIEFEIIVPHPMTDFNDASF